MIVQTLMRQIHKVEQLRAKVKDCEVPDPQAEEILGALDQIHVAYNEMLDKVRHDPDNLKIWEQLEDRVLSLQKTCEVCSYAISEFVATKKEDWGLFQGQGDEDWGLLDGKSYED